MGITNARAIDAEMFSRAIGIDSRRRKLIGGP
jgi:hypothetical protein